MTIGKRLLSLRQERRMSQVALAQELHVSRQTISKWESDLSLPDMKMIITLSEFYHVSITELLGIEEEQNYQESVTRIYEQTKSVLDNIQKENQKRKSRDYIIIAICIISMIIVIGLFGLSYLFPRTIDRTKKEVIINEQIQQETDSFINHSTFEIKSYNLDKMMITVDCQCVLNEYKNNTKLNLVLTDENDQKYTYPMINNQETFNYQEEIPLVNYKNMKVVMEDENQVKKIANIDGENRYLTRLIENMIHVRMERDNNSRLISNEIKYEASMLYFNNYDIIYQGILPGELYIKVVSLDANDEILVEKAVSLGKTTMIELKRDIRNKENIEVSVNAKINGIQYYEETIQKQIRYGATDYEILPRNDIY